MKNEKIFDGITGIREDIIERAEKYEFATNAAEKTARKPINKSRWMKWRSIRYCVYELCGPYFTIDQRYGYNGNYGG